MHFAVCDFILDCIQNSIEAGSDNIRVSITEKPDSFTTAITDNGCGMTDEEVKRALDPFFTDGKKHSKRRVGLGLPFLHQAVAQTEGAFRLDSQKGKGTEIEFTFCPGNIDTPPVGDISDMLLQAMMFDGSFDLAVSRSLEKEGRTYVYSVKRSELIEILGDLNKADSLIMARQFLKSQEENLVEGDR